MVLFGLLVGIAVAAAPAPGTNLTLNAAVELAVSDNADLKSLRARWEAMRERPAQVGSLPNPMLSVGGMDMASADTWPDTNEKRYMVQQEFPWLGKRGLREGIAAKDAEIMRRELEAMTRDVVMRVKERFYDLYAVQRSLAITREDQEVVRRLATVAETLYATGERPQADVIKAQTEITMLKQKILEVQDQEASLKASLNTLLNRRADSPLGPVAIPPDNGFGGNAEALFALAVTNRAEVQAAQAQVDRYQLEKRLMAKEAIPDYKLGLEYRDLGPDDDMVMFTVSMDLPVWRTKYRAGVREAEKMRDSSEAAREAAERQSAFDVQDASFKLRTARRTLELYRTELLPQAEARFSASEAGYRTGQVDFMDLLESQRFLLEVKKMVAMTEGTIGMQIARLERAVGSDTKAAPPP
ncbi:MAG: TolC family protein [Kiritimatiellia bacterium]